MKIKKPFLFSWALLGLLVGYANAQTTYKCKDADGKIQFSDRVCRGGVVVRSKVQPHSPALKAASDARIERDKALADQVQASRMAREEAQRAAQDRQQQVNQGVAGSVEQVRAQQHGNTISVDPGKAVGERKN